jgi:hypothetical protein
VTPDKLIAPRDTNRYKYLKPLLKECDGPYVLVASDGYIDFYVENVVKLVPNAVKVLYGQI